MSPKRENIIKTTKSGRIFMTTKDLLNQIKVKETINYLLDSELIEKIDEKNKNLSKKEKANA